MSTQSITPIRIEYTPAFVARPEITHVLFDFDGTLSIIREGWPNVMVPMFLEMIPPKAGESEEALRQLLTDDILRLNGKQTIYQMMQFAERVQERGRQPQDPLWYKHEYLRRLGERIEGRLSALRSGAKTPEEFQVYGSRALLESLRARGLTLYLASGTDEVFVKQEAELLQLTEFFGPHIYGAKDDYKAFSKAMIIEKILKDHGIQGRQLLAFGDGYVEIQNTKQVGGMAIAVASDEANNGSGQVDPWKRERLLGVGADAVLPDYRDAEELIGRIFDR